MRRPPGSRGAGSPPQPSLVELEDYLCGPIAHHRQIADVLAKSVDVALLPADLNNVQSRLRLKLGVRWYRFQNIEPVLDLVVRDLEETARRDSDVPTGIL